ncbi:PPC domain-containing DNA-binding protein [Amycolatopsis sp. H20-H5]|uniref:PPC domain-containing DNA-binding protein n=1 Tax=Amycolatopsis sp. H20-H5 TaxID=3046309 RepID=UPI002DB5E9A3|nr:PPC domain-containing DNA-binding protein [Amycolatopsis sp. H20-H5]MEC3976592.1 PPC domain-containing DNA-binding protein [Amycolatopsis sp. H20-H5]
MKSARTEAGSQVVLLRLQPGDRLIGSLHRLMDESELVSGVLVCGVGSLAEVTVRAATTVDGQHGYTPAMRRLGPWEVTSLQGQLGRGKTGTVEHHVHGTFAGAQGQIVAGHVDDGVVLVTLEIAILLVPGVGWLRTTAKESVAVEGLPVLEPYCLERAGAEV